MSSQISSIAVYDNYSYKKGELKASLAINSIPLDSKDLIKKLEKRQIEMSLQVEKSKRNFYKQFEEKKKEEI